MGSADSTRECPAFGRCGGCAFLDVDYETQLVAKRNVVGELFSGNLPKDGIDPTLGMANPYAYRNKVIAPFVGARAKGNANAKDDRKANRNANGKDKGKRKGKAKGKGDRIISGMYERGTHNVIECDGCLLENPLGQRISAAVRSLMRKRDIAPYDEDTGEGFMRHLLTRIGHETNEVLVVLVTNSDEFPGAKSFCKELVSKVPEITSIVQNVNKRQTNVILGQRENVLYGPGFILDKLMGLTFRVSSSSFYQVNREMTSALYEKAIELADIKPDDVIFDSYCGTGTIGLAALRTSGRALIGVDDSESSICDARLNAKHNGMHCADFFCADASDFLSSYDGPKPDVAFIDPPRSGSTPAFLECLAELGPTRIVYISCNPITQSRDAEALAKLGYELIRICPVDMFPHTQHIETVALFRKAG